MLNILELVQKMEETNKAVQGQCIVLEEKQGWVKCQTISSGKIWESPLADLKDRIAMHEDGSFSFQIKERVSPFS